MAKSKQPADNRRMISIVKGKTRTANSMGVVVVDPAVRPRDVSVAKIRSAVSAVTNK